MTDSEYGRQWAEDAPPAEWPVRETVVEYETRWFAAGYDLVERPDGGTARYYWFHPGDTASVVARTPDGDLVLVEQYRPRQRERFLELPGGLVEAGEDAVEAGARELREETGFRAGATERLGTYYPSGWTRYERHVVFADDLAPGASDPDEGEHIDVRLCSVEEAVAAVREPPTHEAALTPLLLARDAGVL